MLEFAIKLVPLLVGQRRHFSEPSLYFLSIGPLSHYLTTTGGLRFSFPFFFLHHIKLRTTNGKNKRFPHADHVMSCCCLNIECMNSKPTARFAALPLPLINPISAICHTEQMAVIVSASINLSTMFVHQGKASYN